VISCTNSKSAVIGMAESGILTLIFLVFGVIVKGV